MEFGIRAQMRQQSSSTHSGVRVRTGKAATTHPSTGTGLATNGHQTNITNQLTARERQEKAAEISSRVMDLMMDGKKPSVNPKPTVEKPAPEPKTLTQRFRDGYNNFMEGARAVERQSKHETHIGYGVTGRSEKGSNSIQWSDGTITHSHAEAWEKRVYGSN